MFVWKVFTKGNQYNDTLKTVEGLFLFGIIPIFVIIRKR